MPTSGGSDPNRFTVAAFQVDPERTTCTCPNGVVSTKAYQHGDGDGVSFRFLATQCRGCPVWGQCRDSEANPKGHRSVFISDYHAYLRAGEAFNQTPTRQALLGQRWQVEPTIAWLVRYQHSSPESLKAFQEGSSRPSHGWSATRAAAGRGGSGRPPPNANCTRPARCVTYSCGWAGCGARKCPNHNAQRARCANWAGRGVPLGLLISTETQELRRQRHCARAGVRHNACVPSCQWRFCADPRPEKTSSNVVRGTRVPYSAKLSFRAGHWIVAPWSCCKRRRSPSVSNPFRAGHWIVESK